MNYLRDQTIKGYEFRELIGEGGFGAVYRAYQPVLKREVAIKVILPEFANQPDFIRRFEFEAQLVARLEHPYIVPLYDYWRESGHAYLVMRVLQTSLRATLRNGAWTGETTAQLLDQIAAALTVAHRNGVIHRDIKPDNILLDDDQNAYLVDFGIAITKDHLPQAVSDDLAIGSLAYVAPEQLRGEVLTAKADLFSLGIVLYETLTAQKPFPENLSLQALIDKHLESPVPPLSERRKDLPQGLDAVIQRATAKNPDDRHADALSMAQAFRQALDPRARSVPSIVDHHVEISNPYKGLRAFQEADAADFFGRQILIERLVERLAEPDDLNRVLVVIGPSGSGKSSVVHAGLLSAVRRGALPGSTRWFIASMLPGAHPFENLAAAILSVSVTPPVSLLSQLRDDQQGLTWVIQAMLPAEADTELLLVIDQFEELFTLLDDEAERVHFLNSLAAAVTDPQARLRVVITLRADFVDRPLQYAPFAELVRQRNEFVLPLSAEELEQAIVRPAERAGVSVEAELIATIVRDVGQQPGTLPLLQFALTELFERRTGNMLTLESYQASGGVVGALARQAEIIYSSLTNEQQIAARQLFLRLVLPGEGAEDTRRRVERAELAALAVDKDVLDSVIDIFGKQRLLTFDHDLSSRRPTVEVAHEALIRTWQRLRAWLDASREDLRIQRRLMLATSEWIASGNETSFLADGARLQQFEAWAQDTTLAMSEDESSYLQASTAAQLARQAIDQARQEREARTARLASRFERATIVLALVGVLAVIALVVLGIQASNAATRIEQANGMVTTAQAKVAQVVQTLTPIPMTLVAAQQELSTSKNTVTELGLAGEAEKLLLAPSGNVETAALLSIRALNLAYLPEADSTLRQAVERDYTRRVFIGHTDALYGVAFSPDGKTALSGGADTQARLWDVQTGKTLQVLKGHSDAINGVAFSSDGKYALTGSKDHTIRMWDVHSGRTVRIFAVRFSPVYEPGFSGAVNSVAFSPDGKYVAAGDRDKTARIWDVKTGLSVLYMKHTGGVFSIAYSPDGKYLLAGTREDNAAVLWDTKSGQTVRTFTGHTGPVWAVAFSPDGKSILTGSGDNTARLWDVDTGKTIHVFKGHLSDVTSVSFSPDGKYVLTTSTDGTMRLWDGQSGQNLRIFTGHAGSVWSAAFSPDGKFVISGADDDTARLWDAQPDINPYVFASHAAAVWSVTFSPDGKSVLSGSGDATARVWSVQSRQNLITLQSGKTPIYSAIFSPDGKYILTCTSDNMAYLWDAHSGQQIRLFQTLTKEDLYSAAFSPDGKTVLTAGVDSAARLWDVNTGSLIHTFNGHLNPINSVAFSPDGKYILTGSYDHTARLWDVQSGQTIHTLTGHDGTVASVTFSPDGKYMLSGGNDNTARLWDMASGQQIRVMSGHTNSVSSVAFSPNGKYVLTGSADGTARLWDVQTGQTLRIFSGHTNAVSSVAFSPDGKYALTGSADGTVRLWETNYRDFVAYACTIVLKDFTDDERQHYQIADKTPTCPQFAQQTTSTPTTPAS